MNKLLNYIKDHVVYTMRDFQEVLRLLRNENKLLKEENQKLKNDYALIKKENRRMLDQYHQSKSVTHKYNANS